MHLSVWVAHGMRSPSSDQETILRSPAAENNSGSLVATYTMKTSILARLTTIPDTARVHQSIERSLDRGKELSLVASVYVMLQHTMRLHTATTTPQRDCREHAHERSA
jgi:hypothetical protein